jgi:hypothetical protein
MPRLLTRTAVLVLALMVIVAGAEESSRDHSTTNELCPKALMPNTPFQAPQGKQGCCLVDKALGGMELISDLFRCKSFATGKKADTLITQWFGTGLPCFMSAPVSIRTDLKMCCNIADFEKCATALGDVAQTVVAMTAQFDKCAADPTRAVMTSKHGHLGVRSDSHHSTTCHFCSLVTPRSSRCQCWACMRIGLLSVLGQ